MENDIKHKKIKGTEAVIQALIAEGVDTIFGYPGGQVINFYDSLYDFMGKEIKYYLTRHEQGAIHAAQGYARVTGKPGVVVATSGPGATNLITGLADAMIDSTPLICITGQVGISSLGTDAFQETDMVGISMPVTKWNYQVYNASEIPEVMAKAFYIASSGRPGPVVVDFPKSAQIEEIEFEYKSCKYIRSYNPHLIQKFSHSFQQAADMINTAKKPFAIIGQGVILGNAEDEVLAMLEKANIPTGWTIMGKSAIPTDHPLNMGMLGMHGNYANNTKTNECDVLIAIGMRFSDRIISHIPTYAKQAKIIHLDIDPSEINKNIKVNIPIIGNVKDTVPELTKLLNPASHQEWIDSFAEYAQFEYDKVIDKALHTKEGLIKMPEVVNMISEKTKGQNITVTDVGQHQMYACKYSKCQTKRSLVTSGGLGTMGYGLPASIGAKIGAPDKEVVLYVGDGGLQMTIEELGTIMEYKIGVKIVLLNNHYLGMVRQWQELFCNKRYSSTPMKNPDFGLIAKAYNIEYTKVVKREDLETAIDKMLTTKGSFFLEVAVKANDNVFPLIPAGQPFDKVIFE